MKEVIYQQNRADEFRHRYLYDADNRITHVFTSRNGRIWQQDAKYFYYPHGPLARVEVGHDQVQAFDYAYTLHGWLKGVNSNTLANGVDIGGDGEDFEDNKNRWFGLDAAGFSLGYYDGDYKAISTSGQAFLNDNISNVQPSNRDLFNGNINHMITTINHFTYDQYNNIIGYENIPQVCLYGYDQLNRLKSMDAYRGSFSNDIWVAQPVPNPVATSRYSYDPMGNIASLTRSDIHGQMDDLTYFYDYDDFNNKKGNTTNRLLRVDEAILNSPANNDIEPHNISGAFDIDVPSTWGYEYDRIGNLTKDVAEGISLITWTLSGKVSSVTFDAPKDYDLEFRYDAMGNRIAKISKPKATPGDKVTWTITWYARDAQGNVLAVYSKQTATNNFSIAEFSIFGSKRIGVVTNPEQLTQPVIDPPTPYSYSFEAGMKQYEFSNHLGNVLSTFTDRKYPQDDFSYTALPSGDYEYNASANFYYYVGTGNGNFIQSPYPDGFIDYYTAQITSATDYYPFGMAMTDRNFVGGYRYGFNSMEKDNEIYGEGNSYTAEFWQYDPRIGRRWNVDPVVKIHESPYACFFNNPIRFIDPFGLNAWEPIVSDDGKITYRAEYGDDLLTFMKQFNVTEPEAEKIFINNGLESYIGQEIERYPGYKEKIYLPIPVQKSPNTTKNSLLTDPVFDIVPDKPLQMNWNNNSKKHLVSQWAMTQKWLTENQIETFDWSDSYNFQGYSSVSIINQSIIINGIKSTFTMYFHLQNKTTTYTFPQYGCGNPVSKVEKHSYFLPESAGKKYQNPVLEIITEKGNEIMNYLLEKHRDIDD